MHARTQNSPRFFDPRSCQVDVLHSVREQHTSTERKLAGAEAVLERRLDVVEELAQVFTRDFREYPDYCIILYTLVG